MTCCLTKKKKNKQFAISADDGAATDGSLRERRRDRDVHRRIIKQAPRFFVPTQRIDLRFWKKTEDIIRENLDNYDYFPFGVASPFGIYRLRYTDYSFWHGVVAILAFVAVLLGIIVWTRELTDPAKVAMHKEPDMRQSGQFCVAAFLAICLFLGVWWMFAKSCVHILYLDCQTLSYEIYRGGALRYRGHFHNIYVKLKCTQTVKDRHTRERADSCRYYLTLNGCHFSPIYLSPKSKNFNEMRRLGKRIATNFNLNFVDMDAISKHHQLRHICPYGVGSGNEDLESLFDMAEEWTEFPEGRTSSAGRPRATLKRSGSAGGAKGIFKPRSTKAFSSKKVRTASVIDEEEYTG